jgi:hypothetical protein
MFAKSFKLSFAAGLMMLGAGSLWAAAAVSTPQGCYGMDGKISINLKIPNIVTLALSSPHMSVIGLESKFNEDQSFVLAFPVLSSLAGGVGGDISLPSELNGTWQTTRGSAFSIQTELLDLIGQLQDLGLEAQVTSNSFSGVASNNGNDIRGAFNLGVNVSLAELGNATLGIKGSYTGKSQECDNANQQAKAPAIRSPSNESLDDNAVEKPSVTKFTVDFLKKTMDDKGDVQGDKLSDAIRKFLAGQ